MSSDRRTILYLVGGLENHHFIHWFLDKKFIDFPQVQVLLEMQKSIGIGIDQNTSSEGTFKIQIHAS